jgi:hypothetical protein
MTKDSERAQREDSGGAGAADAPEQGIPALDSMASEGGLAGVAAVPGVVHPEPPGISFREHIVRETLSDLENELTADHHLKDDLEDDLDREPEALPVPSGPADRR